MADEVDRAAQEEEMLLAKAIKARRPAGPTPTGRCLWCDEIVGDTMRWCSVECARDWEREFARRESLTRRR